MPPPSPRLLRLWPTSALTHASSQSRKDVGPHMITFDQDYCPSDTRAPAPRRGCVLTGRDRTRPSIDRRTSQPYTDHKAISADSDYPAAGGRQVVV